MILKRRIINNIDATFLCTILSELMKHQCCTNQIVSAVILGGLRCIRFTLKMKVEAVNVSFDRPQAAYFSGQTVGGSITVNVSEALIIESVYIVCDGTAKVHFTRRRTGVSQRRNRVQHCRAEENYFHQRIQLTPIGRIESNWAGICLS